ncbi:hypothetical protein ACT80S_18395 [Ramlibacter sp. MAHUQ-53]|uniref:hypothetical protein n=1 Tax=unclassified Ramlibacter TaxID=2617605 RepID=UPI003626AF59
MYSDPAYLRKHTVKLSLSLIELDLLDRLCDATGSQKAVLVRELLLERAREVLHESDLAIRPFEKQLTNK